MQPRWVQTPISDQPLRLAGLVPRCVGGRIAQVGVCRPRPPRRSPSASDSARTPAWSATSPRPADPAAPCDRSNSMRRKRQRVAGGVHLVDERPGDSGDPARSRRGGGDVDEVAPAGIVVPVAGCSCGVGHLVLIPSFSQARHAPLPRVRRPRPYGSRLPQELGRTARTTARLARRPTQSPRVASPRQRLVLDRLECASLFFNQTFRKTSAAP